MKKEEIIKAILNDIDCETIEEGEERLVLLSENNEIDDIDRICGILNAGSEGIHFRKITFKDYSEIVITIAVYTCKEFDGTDYEICLEDDYRGDQDGIEQMADDIEKFEKLANSFILSKKLGKI